MTRKYNAQTRVSPSELIDHLPIRVKNLRFLLRRGCLCVTTSAFSCLAQCTQKKGVNSAIEAVMGEMTVGHRCDCGWVSESSEPVKCRDCFEGEKAVCMACLHDDRDPFELD